MSHLPTEKKSCRQFDFARKECLADYKTHHIYVIADLFCENGERVFAKPN